MDFDFLKKQGQALRDFSNTDIEDEEERNTADSIKAAIEKEQEKIKEAQTKDEETADEDSANIEKILKESETKKEEEKKEKGLEEKLADIEKVISTFGNQTNLSSKVSDPFKNTRFNLNKPLVFSSAEAKNYVAPYLQQPTSQDDRIKLLFESLKKQNLI